MGRQKLLKKLERVVTNTNKKSFKRAPKYSQKRKEIGTDQWASKGLEMGY